MVFVLHVTHSQEYLLRAKFGLPSVEADEDVPDKHPPIRVKFEIPYFTVSGIQVRRAAPSICSALVVTGNRSAIAGLSGLYFCSLTVARKRFCTLMVYHARLSLGCCCQVRYLKIIEKSGYQALPWVRYITMAGEYELRMIASR